MTRVIELLSLARAKMPEKENNMSDRETQFDLAVIGLGYVGLPLCLQFAKSGCKVLGLDIDPEKVESLSAGNSYIHHISSESIRDASGRGLFEASVSFERVRECRAVLICVPTPLGKNREPDISFVLDTGRSIAPFLQSGTLVVLESTTYPGTTDEDLRAVLESGSRMKAGTDFHLAFSPEREDPGNPNSRVEKIPKVIGGFTTECSLRAQELYRRAIEKVIPVSNCRTAEATKLLENIFRSVNIALVNELKMVYGAMGIDVWEVIEAAKTKPFGYMPFYPGPGLGGHCIPIDPFYLTWKAREYGQATRFIELAGEVNTAMPTWVIQNVYRALNEQRKSVRGSKILVLGLAYKADVDDTRESPSYVLMDMLSDEGAEVAFYDPYVSVVPKTRNHPKWAGQTPVVWKREVIESFDAVLISTAHKNVCYAELGEWATLIIDTRNAMSGIPARGVVWKA